VGLVLCRFVVLILPSGGSCVTKSSDLDCRGSSKASNWASCTNGSGSLRVIRRTASSLSEAVLGQKASQMQPGQVTQEKQPGASSGTGTQEIKQKRLPGCG
jgi:hypothetical protein